MATWKLTPDTGQVSGTNANMPLAVIPSLAGIGTITLAEAQSSRFYTDSSLVTEVAREVVSSDEIHHKPGTVDSSLESYMDFDGVRADYTVTDTYGARNVWGGYEYVSHNGGGTDSTGNYSPTANGGVTAGGATGKVGDATTFDGTDDYFSLGTMGTFAVDNLGNSTWTTWQKTNTTSNIMWGTFNSVGNTGLNIFQLFAEASAENTCFLRDDDGDRVAVFGKTGSHTTRADNSWHKVTTVFDKTSSIQFLDGADDVGSVVDDGFDAARLANFEYLMPIGARNNRGTIDIFCDATYDEIRIKNTRITANWETTEYNNQDDNAAFWIATDVSGGGGWNGYPMIHMLQFNCVM